MPLVRLYHLFSLDPSAFQSTIAHNNGAIISPACNLPARSQDDPEDLLYKKAASQDEQEHMSRDIMPTAPISACRPARRGREKLLLARGAGRHGLVGDFTPASCEPESAVDDGRAEAPLRDEHPPTRDESPARRSLGGRPAVAERRMCCDEGKEGRRDPQPPALDEDDVEQVVLAREVRWRMRLHV